MKERRNSGEGNRRGQRAGLVGENGGVVLWWRNVEGRKLKAEICLERARAFERGQRERRRGS